MDVIKYSIITSISHHPDTEKPYQLKEWLKII